MAAAQADVQSQAYLGEMYEMGTGLLQDNLRSHMWYNIAAANYKENLTSLFDWRAVAENYRNLIARRMTPEDLSKAQAMARECMSSKYKECGY